MCCLYRPPSSSKLWVNSFHSLLDDLTLSSNELVITGDFNINLLHDNSLAELDILYNITQIINTPTRIAKKSTTLIDHIYVSKLLAIRAVKVINIHLSDHCLVECDIIKNLLKTSESPCHNVVKYISTKNLDTHSLKCDLQQAPWSIINIFDDFDDALMTFEQIFSNIWDTHAPMKKRQRRHKRAPWITKEINHFRRCRNQSYKTYLNNKTEEN